MGLKYWSFVLISTLIIWLLFSLGCKEFSFFWFICILIPIMIVGGFISMIHWSATASNDEKHEAQFGKINEQLVCPHCQIKGKVRTTQRETNNGISGGKATGAILTGGVSLLATGLSKKGQCTQAHCDSCNSTWSF